MYGRHTSVTRVGAAAWGIDGAEALRFGARSSANRRLTRATISSSVSCFGPSLFAARVTASGFTGPPAAASFAAVAELCAAGTAVPRLNSFADSECDFFASLAFGGVADVDVFAGEAAAVFDGGVALGVVWGVGSDARALDVAHATTITSAGPTDDARMNLSDRRDG
jgi:hypothetical protein